MIEKYLKQTTGLIKSFQEYIKHVFNSWCLYDSGRCKFVILLCRATISIVPAGIFSFLLFWFFTFLPSFTLFRELHEPIAPDWYLNSFFHDQNFNDDKETENKEIVRVCIADSICTRGMIAHILQIIASKSPKVIGLDISLYGTNNYNSSQNDSIIRALKKLRDDSINVVYATYREKNGNLLRPFYMNTLYAEKEVHPLNKIKGGIVNHDAFDLSSYKCYPYGKDSLRFSTCVAEVATGKSPLEYDNIFINFTKKSFYDVTISDSTQKGLCQLIKEDLKGCIVLVGVEDNPNDIPKFPFPIENNLSELSGLKVLAYEINTLIAKEMRYEETKNYPYKELCFGLNLGLAIFFSIIFFLLLEVVNCCIKEKRRWIYSLLYPFILLAFEWCVIWIYKNQLTEKWLIIPDAVLTISLIAFTGMEYEILGNVQSNKLRNVQSNKEEAL